MFARNVAIRLKSNTLDEFTKLFDNEVLPILQKQPGFLDEIALLTSPTGMDLITISLWESREHADAYHGTGYPEVLNVLAKVLDAPVIVRVSEVISSTLHKTIAVAA